LADYIGPHKIMLATDYPRSDGFFPGAPQMIGERIWPSLTAEEASGVGRRRDGVLRRELAAVCLGFVP
jgi:hypothetical protein